MWRESACDACDARIGYVAGLARTWRHFSYPSSLIRFVEAMVV